LLTVIQVCRVADESALPVVSRLDEDGIVGVRVGATVVRFDLASGPLRVSACRTRNDGTHAWFEHTS